MNGKFAHAIHPYYQNILEAYRDSGRPHFHQVSPAEARALMRSSLAAARAQIEVTEIASVTDESVLGPSCDIAIRRYRPQGNPVGICVFLHAGGWVMGDVDSADPLCRRLAVVAGCEIVSVAYRLAPENPFPAALEDTCAVLEWAATETQDALLVAGESAGANLAAAITIHARDTGLDLQLAGQFLAYPVTDHDFGTRSYRELGSCNYLLSEADMRWFWDQYCPPSVDRSNPLLSPLRSANAAGLPPALILVAEFDPLRDEGLAYAAHLRSAGIEVESRCDKGMLHGYLSAAGTVPVATAALNRAGEWMRTRIRGS